MNGYDDLYGWPGDASEGPLDAYEQGARDHLRRFFEQNRDRVFFSRQLAWFWGISYIHGRNAN